ncbi:hypothetical protein CPB86DRAFT_781162 [Serendipita vermifera]|nr:hypothetical protein CPB86DRAFT_781162 [Serendipita vermifera]
MLTQVCGTLRDVVIGLPSLWNKILLDSGIKLRNYLYEVNTLGFQHCRNRGHLDLLLRRARSSHLHIYIACPPSPDMVALLSYHTPTITSMSIDKGSSSSDGINRSDFETLNLESLQELKLQYIKPEDVGLIMDLALQSTCQLGIELKMKSMTSELLRHELLERAVKVDISAEMDEPLALPKIRLPRVDSFRIHGPSNLFNAFELSDSRMSGLTYWCRDEDYIFPASLPIQLYGLTLSSFAFTSKPLKPHLLEHLTALEFGDTTLEYPLQEYIALPKLKYLDIWNVLFQPSEDNEDRDGASDTSLSEKSFLGGLPELETITIKHTTLNGYFAKALESCPRLESIEIEECDADVFFLSFLSCLRDEDAFPSLETLNILLSWPWKLDLPFEVFVKRCADRRPDIDISGDGEYY